MNGQRVITALVALSLIVVAGLTIRTAVVTSAVVSSGKDLSDYGLRHPNARIVVESTPDLSDYALRHPELWRPGAPGLSSPK